MARHHPRRDASSGEDRRALWSRTRCLGAYGKSQRRNVRRRRPLNGSQGVAASASKTGQAPPTGPVGQPVRVAAARLSLHRSHFKSTTGMLGLPLGFSYFEAATKAEYSHLLRELSDDDLHGGGYTADRLDAVAARVLCRVERAPPREVARAQAVACERAHGGEHLVDGFGPEVITLSNLEDVTESNPAQRAPSAAPMRRRCAGRARACCGSRA